MTEWRWKAREDNAVYMKVGVSCRSCFKVIFPHCYYFSFRQILSKFLDTRDSDYSIQMIGESHCCFFFGNVSMF